MKLGKGDYKALTDDLITIITAAREQECQFRKYIAGVATKDERMNADIDFDRKFNNFCEKLAKFAISGQNMVYRRGL